MQRFIDASNRCLHSLLLLLCLTAFLPANAQRNGAMKVSVTVLPSCLVSAESRGLAVPSAGLAQVVCATHYPFHASLRETTKDVAGIAMDADTVALSNGVPIELQQGLKGNHTVMRLTVAY